MARWCSVVVLCLGGIATLAAIALVSIAFTTDHWSQTVVNRRKVAEHFLLNSSDYSDLSWLENCVIQWRVRRYFSRTRGLFRMCFHEKERPAEGTGGLYLSPIEEWCMSREYHLELLQQGIFSPPANLSLAGGQQLQLARATPLLVLLYLLTMALAGAVGLNGCWRQSANSLITTAAIQLFSAVTGAAAMATWHAALFLEMEKVTDDGFPLSWPDWLQQATLVSTGWSYILAWLGLCLTLFSSLSLSFSAICLRSHRRNWEDQTMRMRLKMASMFAQHAYFPPDSRNVDYPTIAARYPTYQYRAGTSPLHTSFDELDESRLNEYRKVVSQMEKSKF